VDGILNIDKPRGRTSFSIVAVIRRLSGEKRVGHAGTLDPDATGVLPVCLGQGTRVTEFLVDTTKAYRAVAELGAATDTCDAGGRVTFRGDYTGIGREQLEAALEAFRGDIRQTPPMYSAVKHQGRPLYALARAGITVARKSRPAKIYRLEVLAWEPPLVTIEVECGKGTYIRSLADDLGQALGCGAHLKSLVRTRCGVFGIGDAVDVPRLEEAFRHGYWTQFIYPIDIVLRHYPAAVVDSAAEEVIKNGGKVTLEETGEPAADRCRAYSRDGRFIAVLRRAPGEELWRPKKVFA